MRRYHENNIYDNFDNKFILLAQESKGLIYTSLDVLGIWCYCRFLTAGGCPIQKCSWIPRFPLPSSCPSTLNPSLKDCLGESGTTCYMPKSAKDFNVSQLSKVILGDLNSNLPYLLTYLNKHLFCYPPPPTP